MLLNELTQFNNITIQCHDFPDADAIASGWALYEFFKSKGKNVEFIYSGRAEITKANLVLMIKTLNIPIKYVKQNSELANKDLLITVDCQYGAGNVSNFTADEYAIIDHHQVEKTVEKFNHIKSEYNSCSTVVWELLKEEGFELNTDISTALYYGLYTDSGMLAELSNSHDRDMIDSLEYSKMQISSFRNCNISVKELDIAGMAILRYSLNDDYHFAVIKSNPCDPNVLGLISDFLLQVDGVNTCVVFAENEQGIKISVRSCVREVNAAELAEYLTDGIGSGGGHYEKAGGWVSINLFHEKYPYVHAEGYFNNKMIEYYNSFTVVIPEEFEVNVDELKTYKKLQINLGFVRTVDIFPSGTPMMVRTIEGDSDFVADENNYIMIGVKGEVYPIHAEKFNTNNIVLDEPYEFEKCVLNSEYEPKAKNKITGEVVDLLKYANLCKTTGSATIYAKPIDTTYKIFTPWFKESYMLGKPGDFLAVRMDDLHDMYIIEKQVFAKTYAEV